MKHSFRQGRVLTLLLLLAVPLLGAIVSSATPLTAKAAASGYVFVYDSRKEDAIKKEIQRTNSLSVGSLENTPNLNTTMVRAASGGLNSGDKTTDLKFSSSKVNGAYLFKTKLTCTISGSAIKTYIDIELPLGSDFANKKSYTAKETVISYLTDSNYNESTGATTQLPDGDGYGKEQSSGCFSQSTTSAQKSIVVKNFQELSSSEKDEWRDAESNSTDRGELGSTGENDGDTPCIGGAMGWIMCPIINYMADAVRAVAGFIDGMMQFKLLIGSESGKAIRDAMNNFIGLANIILVIAFLFIIFSQSSSLGLSNYNIKRMLPRIVVAAVLINLSFYICAFAIDISNIVGNSILGLISGQGTTDATISQGIAESTKISGPSSVQNVFGGLLAAAIGVVLLIVFFTPLVLGVILTFVILVARQVILLFLVIVAPLAFAAWLLPNTESWFKKWKDLFINMLMAYPIIMTVFGVALFASKFLSDPAIQDSETSGLIGGAAVGPLIALVILAIPLLAIPFILKSSSSMLAKVANAAQKYGGQQASGKMGDGLKKAPGIRNGYEMMEQRKENMEAARKKGITERAASRTGRLKRRAVGGFGRTKTSEEALRGLDGRAQSQIIALDDQEVKEASAAIGLSSDFMKAAEADQLDQLKTLVKSKDTTEARAAANMLAQRGAPGLNALKEFAGDKTVNTDTRDSVARQLRSEHRDTLEQKMPELLHGFAKGAGQTDDTVETALSDPKTWAKVKASNVDQLDDTSLQAGIKAGGIDRSTLEQVKQDSQAWSDLTPAKRGIIEAELAKYPSSPSSGSAGGTPPSSGGSSGGGGWNSGGGKSTTEGEIRFTR